FGDRKLVWSLASHGQTQQVAGTLKPVWQIDRRFTTRGGNSEKIDSNTPPVVVVRPTAPTVTLPAPLTLSVSATDDGLPKRRGKTVGMTILWAKYRGPGSVTFGSAKADIVDGKVEAVVRFDQPGEYVLQAVVDDGSGEAAGIFGYHCC